MHEGSGRLRRTRVHLGCRPHKDGATYNVTLQGQTKKLEQITHGFGVAQNVTDFHCHLSLVSY